MQIIAGKYKGRKLLMPAGSSSKTRPTSAINREAWISILLNNLSQPLAELAAVDAFAGSGALGIELLSRGARHCTFVELEPKTVSILRQNTSYVDADSYTVYKGNSLQNNTIARVFESPVDVLILDPPYTFTSEQIVQYLSKILDAGGLKTGALISYEHESSQTNNHLLSLSRLSLLKEYKSGACAIDFYELVP